jgi:hypothetical protein
LSSSGTLFLLVFSSGNYKYLLNHGINGMAQLDATVLREGCFLLSLAVHKFARVQLRKARIGAGFQ